MMFIFSYFLLPLMLLLLLGLKDCLIERKHLCIKLSYDTCTLAQIAADILRCIALELVIYLVLKACPPVHGDGAELHLDAHHALLIVQEDGRFHDEMQAAVAVGLRVCDVVLAL